MTETPRVHSPPDDRQRDVRQRPGRHGAPPVRRRRGRRRRRRPARRDRRARRGREDRRRLQVAARQGAHRDGRGRHRRGHGQPLARGQLGGALPRHHAWREDAQQLADGPAARPGGARAGAGARGLGRAVRPHRRRADLPARLRRPPVRPARPRRRPHRPGDDPHPPAARRRARHRRLHGVHGHRPVQGRRRRDRRRVRLLARDRPVHHVRGAGGDPGHRRHRQVVQGHLELVGVHRRRPRARAARRCRR